MNEFFFFLFFLSGGVEEFREKYPEWCVTRESAEVAAATAPSSSSSDGLPNLRLASGDAINGGPNRTTVQRLSTSSSANNVRRPGSLGSRSASDSEEERPDSSLESKEGGPPEFGSGFSLGLSVGLRLGLDSDPMPPLMLDSVDINPAGGVVAMDSAVDPLADPGFPVEILPHLFLGNAQNSRDCDALDKHHIRVRFHLPNIYSAALLFQCRLFSFLCLAVCGECDSQLAQRL